MSRVRIDQFKGDSGGSLHIPKRKIQPELLPPKTRRQEETQGSCTWRVIYSINSALCSAHQSLGDHSSVPGCPPRIIWKFLTRGGHSQDPTARVNMEFITPQRPPRTPGDVGRTNWELGRWESRQLQPLIPARRSGNYNKRSVGWEQNWDIFNPLFSPSVVSGPTW